MGQKILVKLYVHIVLVLYVRVDLHSRTCISDTICTENVHIVRLGLRTSIGALRTYYS
jgi:hypothetical protein